MKSQRIVFRVPGLLAAVAVAGMALSAGPAAAQTSGATKSRASAPISDAELQERIDDLEKQLQQLRTDTRVLEVSDEEQKKARPVAGYSAKDGFFLNSPDGRAFKLRVGGYSQADSRWTLDERDNPSTDAFTIRRARLDVRGTIAERFDFRIMPDFAGSSLVLQDAYVDHKFAPWFVLRAGKMKSPVGLERLQSGTNLLFMERSHADSLLPNRDLGIQIGGDIHQGEFTYQLAVLNGVVDGGSTDADVNDAVDVAARVFGQPFINTTIEPLRGLGVGVSGTYGKQQGTASSPQLPQFRTSNRSTFFRYSQDNPATAAGTTVANGEHWRVSPQAYYYIGPFGSMFEYSISDQELSRGAVQASTQNHAWQLRGSWLLTGEKANYRQIVPNNNFNFGNGGWGAWELALRYSNLDVDDDTFSKGFADPARSATEVDSITTAINWYLNTNVFWTINYEHNIFEGGAAGGSDRDNEDAFLTRIQFVF